MRIRILCTQWISYDAKLQTHAQQPTAPSRALGLTDSADAITRFELHSESVT